VPQRVLHIAAYDIRNAKRLRQALRVMKQYATGGQKSLFECFLTDAEMTHLGSQMLSTIDPREDRFLLVRLDPRARIWCLGVAVPPEDPPYFYAG
jgi:CRISPR-associated protein Cas2